MNDIKPQPIIDEWKVPWCSEACEARYQYSDAPYFKCKCCEGYVGALHRRESCLPKVRGMAERIGELESIVDQLPKNRAGEPLLLFCDVFVTGPTCVGENEVLSKYIEAIRVGEFDRIEIFVNGWDEPVALDDIFLTREAAEAAKDTEGDLPRKNTKKHEKTRKKARMSNDTDTDGESRGDG